MLIIRKMTAGRLQCGLRRASSVRGYIIGQWGFINQQAIQITRPKDYLSAWVRAVECNTGVPRRDKVLEILKSDASVPTKWANIQLLAGGAAQYMEQQISPLLRNAMACVITIKQPPFRNLQKERQRNRRFYSEYLCPRSYSPSN